jgi:hypothetical protein
MTGPAVTIERVAPSTADADAPAATSGSTPIEHPGRWLGGAIGAAASLLAALVAALVSSGEAGDGLTSLTNDWLAIGLLGIPIGFALGRQLLPTARSGGWGTALMTGVGLGLAAPPLGAIEILLGWGLVPPNGVGSPAGLGTLVLLPFAIPISFVAVVMTVPVGIAWAIAARLVGQEWLERVAAPAWLAAFGIRHAVLLVVVLVIAGPLARAFMTP